MWGIDADDGDSQQSGIGARGDVIKHFCDSKGGATVQQTYFLENGAFWSNMTDMSNRGNASS
jgi:hypothetical protein